MLRALGSDLYEFENLFLADFLRHYGCFPICNGQSGISVVSPTIDAKRLNIVWKSFEE